MKKSTNIDVDKNKPNFNKINTAPSDKETEAKDKASNEVLKVNSLNNSVTDPKLFDDRKPKDLEESKAATNEELKEEEMKEEVKEEEPKKQNHYNLRKELTMVQKLIQKKLFEANSHEAISKAVNSGLHRVKEDVAKGIVDKKVSFGVNNPYNHRIKKPSAK